MKPRTITLSLDDLHVVLTKEAASRLGLPSGSYYSEMRARVQDGKIIDVTVTVEPPRGVL